MSTHRQQIVAGSAALLLVILGVLAARPWLSPAGAAPLGDASCDGQVNAVDATVILQLTAGLIPSLECPENADTDGDGSVGAVDATLVLQLVAGLIPGLEPPATATPTRTSTPTPTPTPIATNTPASTKTPAPPATPAATATATATEPPTATSTATATATVNGSATATATPTRTPTPLSTVHVRKSSTYTDTFGDLWAVGEVYNGLGHDVAYVSVTADLFSASNELLGSETYGTCVTSIKRHTDTPFGVLIFDPPAGVDHVAVRVNREASFDYIDLPSDLADPPVEGMDISIINASRQAGTDGQDFYHVDGAITNGSINTYDFVQACIALYDNRGVVVRMTAVAANDDRLERGGGTLYDTGEIDDLNVTGINIVTQRAWVEAAYELP